MSKKIGYHFVITNPHHVMLVQKARAPHTQPCSCAYTMLVDQEIHQMY